MAATTECETMQKQQCHYSVDNIRHHDLTYISSIADATLKKQTKNKEVFKNKPTYFSNSTQRWQQKQRKK